MAYQKDTTAVNNSLKNIFMFQNQGELRIDRSVPVTIVPIPVRDSLPEEGSSATQAQSKPTLAQIRYWRRLREQKLLIGDSRYIEPRNDVYLAGTVIPDNYGMGLPSREINSSGADWLTVTFMLVLVVFASVRNSYSKYLNNLFKGIVNYSTSFRMFREKNYPFLHGAYRLEFFFYIVFSVFMLQVINFLPVEVNHSDIKLFFICLAVTLAYYFFKKLAYQLSGIITERNEEAGEYLFNMDNINRVAGIILFPLVITGVFFPYSNNRFYVIPGLLILLILYLKLLQRGFLILFKKQFSIFYLFLYFCTLEFVPLVLLYNILEI